MSNLAKVYLAERPDASEVPDLGARLDAIVAELARSAPDLSVEAEALVVALAGLPARIDALHEDAALEVALALACARNEAAALARFEERYGSDPLVLDKWFQIQAAAPGRHSLETVRSLSEHRAFSLANPNRIRSLIGTFSSANQTGFHRPDGEGYRFFTEMVFAVERRNPQVAARLATALRSWRSLEPGRRALAREALLRISSAENLSPDLRDIVERTLA